jgi:DNA-binding beta-propeller fold protein YncE/ABC-type spermidine/putrescine transport system permease subunit II
LAGLCAGVAAFCAPVRGGGWWGLAASLVTFLAGGQLLAIGLLRLYNRPALSWISDGPGIVVMAYFARFGWLALLAAAVTKRSRPWRAVRDLAAVDGASESQTAVHVVWPLAWPVLGAAAVLVMVLGLTEAPATVLISPFRPRPLIPMLMTWVHMLRYDEMLEGSLLLMALVLVLALIITVLTRLGLKLTRHVSRAGTMTAALLLLTVLLCGCGDPKAPEDIWLRTGPGPGQVVYPRAIDYNPRDDSFWVIDRLARVQHIDHAGHYIADWTMPQSQNGRPTGVSVGPDDNVYVPDTHYQRVMVYTKDGQLVRQWGSVGTGPGQFIYPTDVAFDDKDHVFVSEYGDNARIQVFDREGKFLYAFGRFGQGDGELTRPQSMVIDDGLVYVTDASNHRIAVFKTDGTFVRNMGSVGSGPGQFRWPYGLYEDRHGNLVVCEFGNNRLQLIDRNTGRCLGIWGGGGMAPGELKYPWAVAVDKRNRVVAVDSGNNRLQVFEF